VGKTSAELAKKVKEEPVKVGDLEAARASVVTAQVALQSAQKSLEQTVLRAPAAGTIATVSGHVGQDVSGGGVSSASSSSSSSSSSASSNSSSNSSSSALVTLVDLGGLTVTAGFSESDAAKIKVGKPATITLDALPDAKLAAHVVSVDVLSTVVSNVVTYNVTFAIDRSTAGVKPGMSASVDVITQERSNVVNVPSSAVTGSGSNASVTLMQNGTQVRRSVVAGLQGDSTTEIVSGLNAGATVVLPTSTFSSTNTGNLGTGANRGNGTFGRGGGAVFGPLG
jgi:multidrug efflux pump subunit AcrA (membrane-fusion protein)